MKEPTQPTQGQVSRVWKKSHDKRQKVKEVKEAPCQHLNRKADHPSTSGSH